VARPPLVDRAWQQRRPGPQRQRGGAAGHHGRRSEQPHRQPAAGQVTVADQAGQAAGAQGAQHPAQRLRAVVQRQQLHAEVAAEGGEALVQLGRLQPLDHRGDRVAAGGQPGPAGIPVADVGGGEDRSASGRDRRVQVLAADQLQPPPDLLGPEILQPERLDPVAAVGGEPAADRRLQLGRADRRTEHLPQVGPQGPAPAGVQLVEDPPAGPPEREGDRRGQPAAQLPGQQPAAAVPLGLWDHLVAVSGRCPARRPTAARR
jgi:hypothetical protein